MTLRVLLSIDPGVTGASAIFKDGELDRVTRLPVLKTLKTARSKQRERQKTESVFQVHDFIDQVRQTMRDNQGAYFTAVIERVGTNAIGQAGLISICKLVSIAHAMEGVLLALGWDVVWVQPAVWKRHMGLLGQDKQASRAKASELYPWLKLETKVSADLAEAVLIGVYGCERYGA